MLKVQHKQKKVPLFIVIPVFNGWGKTKQCLDCLLDSSFKNIKILLIDHGSSDNTKKEIVHYPEVQHITASADLWWTGATNVGIREAIKSGAKYIMLLNNDCFFERDTIEKLMCHFNNEETYIVAPVQQNYPAGNTISSNVTTCFALGYPTLVLPWSNKFGNHPGNLKPASMIVGGRGVIIPAVVLGELGLFDEKELPHYGADHDFYLRCRQKNISLYIATDATVQVDQTKTTLSRNPGVLNFRQFLNTFSDRRSHRNFDVLLVLFKRYYPVKGLYFVGILLNITRYVLLYLVRRVIFISGNIFRPGSSVG
ncbi:MAG TPA: glycosyltransferase family 2 protein [Acidiferrobacteraceae bacterium]|nr:glycosyltransferase family 2 protein [Acidiferrobacteraceae bacterium]HEX19864.1 glycosyltransferase family 2 protein [Acidiferrobacteraceae bacterium]